MQVFIGKHHFDPACTGEIAATLLGMLDQGNEGIPLQPAAIEKLANRRGGLQRQPYDFFRLLVVVAGKKGVAVELSAQGVDGLRIFLRQGGQLQVHPAVAFAVSKPYAIHQLGKQCVAVADHACSVVKETAGVDLRIVKLRLNLARGKPGLQRGMLLCRGQQAGVVQVDVLQGRGVGLRAWLLRGCSGGRIGRRVGRCVGLLQGLDLPQGRKIPFHQLFDIENGAKNRGRCAAAGAGHLGADRGCGLFGNEAALVAPVNGHGESVFALDESECPVDLSGVYQAFAGRIALLGRKALHTASCVSR